jgi:hypothetical protein
MLSLNGLLVMTALGLGGYYWITAIKVKEATLRAVEAHCSQAGVQLLDGTIFLRRLWVARDRRGQLQLTRVFQFEFTATGDDRNLGWARLLGRRIESIELSPHRFH